MSDAEVNNFYVLCFPIRYLLIMAHLKQCFLIINVVIGYHDPFQDRVKDLER
jgi:hypothetical protein